MVCFFLPSTVPRARGAAHHVVEARAQRRRVDELELRAPEREEADEGAADGGLHEREGDELVDGGFDHDGADAQRRGAMAELGAARRALASRRRSPPRRLIVAARS